MEKIVKVQKITQRVEDTQYRHSAVGEDFKSGSSSDSLNKLWTYTSSQILKQTMQRKKTIVRVRDQANDQARRLHSEGGEAKIIKIAVQSPSKGHLILQVLYTLEVKIHESNTMKV